MHLYNMPDSVLAFIVGETVDIVAIEVDRANSPKKISMAYARHLGGMKVTTGFERLLKDIFGAGAFKKFAENHLGHFIELMQEFEKLKRSLQVDSEESVTVTIPTPLIEIYQTKTAKKLEDNKVLKHLGMTASENKLVFTAVVINELFKEQCEDIVKQVSRFLEKDKLTNVSAVVMVGGFSESVILQQTIKQSFPYLKIIVAKDSSLCVLKGAVMHGQIQV